MPSASISLAAHPLIDIDGTVFVQFALFLILFVIANKFLFQPYLALRERRKAGIEGARAEATKMSATADAKLAELLGRGKGTYLLQIVKQERPVPAAEEVAAG